MPRNAHTSCIVATMLLILFATSCTYRRATPDIFWDYTPEQRDSILFARTHHYSQNFNFRVCADSLVLLPSPPTEPIASLADTAVVLENDRIVVADFVYSPADSVDTVWIKVARDQYTIGWLHERDLLDHAVPDDPISEFIRFFGNRRTIAVCILAVVAAAVWLIRLVRRKRIRIVHFNDIDSPYPPLLCLDIAAIAVLYATIQHFTPGLWQEFYFTPTLNPFILHPLVGALITCVWLMVLLAIATVDDVANRLRRDGSLPYLLSLTGAAMVVYLVFAVSTWIYLGYAFLPVYAWFALRRYRSNKTYRYLCGRCGHKLRHKGTCPNCGARND